MSATKQLEDAVFYAAASIADAQQRKEFLDQACVGNAGLRAVVEEMLSAQREAEGFFDKGRSALFISSEGLPKPPPASDGAAQDSSVDEYVGTCIGSFKLLQRIGEGGCGVVYMAEQGQPVRRKVAVKVIKPGMDTKSVMARFDAERQALALMDHPNIARVLDAGATENGRPYFVMELVRGTKITEYCDQRNLDTRQRLELFIQVCHAVQHAHQKGIIHRDLKPSNILVTLHDGVAVPKVIDFGIAKAMHTKLTEQTLFTPYQQLIGTPAYMSPEQAEMSGLDVDTRTDIYALGVLLYELLTGRTPFDGTELIRSGLDEMRRTLREKEPQRPSTILTTLHGTELKATAAHRHEEPPHLISFLKGDLDWIVMKTLEKDRARRYETANGLAADVLRFLNNEPVVARPPSRLYRLQKLVHRNRIVFAASAIVAAALILGLGVSTCMFIRERQAKKEQLRLRLIAESAGKRENELRQQAEAREQINQAAIFVSQEKYDDANRILEAISTPPPKPSFDGVSAYRSVGEWLALQSRWKEAAERFSALMEIDKLDKWGAVTLDYQACGVVLVESGELDRYQRFCRSTIAAFVNTTNADAAGRVLKTCLLTADIPKELMTEMEPMGRAAEDFFISVSTNSGYAGWAAIPPTLWRYRCGDYDKVLQLCHLGLNESDNSSAQYMILRTLEAMAEYKNGNATEARTQLSKAGPPIDAAFRNWSERGDPRFGYWYDWLFAQILLREARSVMESPTAPVSASQ
jgi:serine/threonine protein kinase